MLNVYVGRKHDSGSAMMAKKMGGFNFGNAVTSGLIMAPGTYWYMAFFGDLPSICFTLSNVTSLFPDMYVGIDIDESDRLKRLTYHELAHTSHYTNVNNTFWQSVVIAEVAASGHGNENSFDAGRIALVESWAEHIGRSFAHMTYGTNNSRTFPTYQWYLENQRNEETNHIPIGYYQDLIDGINTTETARDFGNLSGAPIAIFDDVSGLTNAQLFSLLNSNTTSVGVYTSSLISSGFIQSPNTTQSINNLFNSY